jgi:hypothetical protein
LVYLKGINSLDLGYNRNMTDKGLVHLKGIKSLDLRCNGNITDKGVVHLKGIDKLYFARPTIIGNDRSVVFDD